MFDAQLTERAKKYEWYETDVWASERILDVELLTPLVLDPAAGRGVLGNALRKNNYICHETDLNEWPDQPESVDTGVDFLGDFEVIAERFEGLMVDPNGFSVMMNPPFSRAVEFVERSLELGARKVIMFQRMAFLEAAARRVFYEELPPARVWLCGDRATCWRGDIPPEDILDENGEIIFKGKKGRSASTPHAWFVWERGHTGAMITKQIYKS